MHGRRGGCRIACAQVIRFYSEKSAAAKAHASSAKAEAQRAIDAADSASGAAPIDAAVRLPLRPLLPVDPRFYQGGKLGIRNSVVMQPACMQHT